MENKLINDFEIYLRNDFRCNYQELAVISVTHMEDDDITLLLMDKNDGIGGLFVVFPLRSHHCKADYLEYDMAVPNDEYFAPPKYDIGEFAEFMDWCFQKGWRVRLDLSEIYLLREKRWINRFTIEHKEKGDGYTALESWLKSRNYKCAYLIKDNELILSAFKSAAPTPIFAFYCDKETINIGHFLKDSSGCIEIGFSEAADCGNLDCISERIQVIQEEIYIQTQIPYLDELMRWQGYFENPDEVIREYAKKIGYSLYPIIP